MFKIPTFLQRPDTAIGNGGEAVETRMIIQLTQNHLVFPL